MNWPIKKSGARLLEITPDEVEGALFICALFDEGVERDIVYEGMFYSQLDERSAGLVITSVLEVTPEGLKRPEYEQAAARLYDECAADDAFLHEMYCRGNHLYVHQTEDGGKYIVLAKRLAFGETRLHK